MAKNSPDFIFTLDKDERIIYINKIEILNLEMKDVIGKPVYDFIADKYHESARDSFKRVFKLGQNDRYYSDFIYDDGTIHYFESRVGPILNEGIVVGLTISSTDITERKKAEEELKKFKSISDNANYGIGISDIEGKLVYTNNYFASIHGYKTGELIGKNLSIFYNDKQIERVMKLKQKLIDEGSYNAEEVGHTRKNGTMFPMLMNGITINDDKGKPLFMATTAIDITEIKEAEKKLKESEEKFRNIADQSLLGICILQDDVIKYANQRMADINGYSLEEIMKWLPKEFYKTVAAESLDFVSEQAKKKQLGLPDTIPQYTIQIIKKSGKKIWVENFSKTINFNGRPADLVTFFDISDKKEVEQNLRESEAKLSTAIESLPFPFFLLDESGRYIMQNTNAKKTWGDLIGKTPKDIAKDEETLSLWLSNNSRVFSGETIASEAEYNINGESHYFIDIVSPVYIDDKIHNILGVNIDITARKHLEQELRESEEKFRNIADQSLMGICIVQDDIIKYTNQRMADINGYSLEEIMNWQPHEFYKTIPTESLDFVSEQAKKKQLGLSGVIPQYQLQVIKKSGEKIWVENFSKTINFNGRPADLVIFFDINDKKKAEQRLKESEEILRATLESTADGILAVDDRGRVTHTNSKFADMWHISQELIEERD
ncbi:hypothetical protein LCGC14_0784680, partial [marine sediment metagenome]